MLVGELGATHVAVGENFRFGHKAQGDPALLARRRRFETRVVPLLEVDGEVVCSEPHPRARRWAARSSTPAAARRAVRHATARSSHGDKRGRELGFPTANLVPARGLRHAGPRRLRLPRAATASGRAAVNVGVRPTFETGRGELIEAYLLDFDGDLYGQPLRLEFLKRLRGERRFDTVEALVEQMRRDVDERARSPPRGLTRRRHACLLPFAAA